MWANLGQIKEMYSNEVYDIIIIIILWPWNMKWWVSELKGRGGGGVGPDPLEPPPPPPPGSAPVLC